MRFVRRGSGSLDIGRPSDCRQLLLLIIQALSTCHVHEFVHQSLCFVAIALLSGRVQSWVFRVS